ncbi:transcription factor RFX3-like isoform X2 [Halichondria panicea]|uniref:transcription factor RFX3-like isoform X2 n=1 Tax=Halichondria panicea TaxID=6063 RepID=UPI00312B32DA
MLSVMQSHGQGMPYEAPPPACVYSTSPYQHYPPHCTTQVHLQQSPNHLGSLPLQPMRIKAEPHGLQDMAYSCLGSSQFVSPYVDTTAGIPQSTMISLQQQQGLQSGSYYEASLQQMGMHGDPSMQHTTRAHPQTVQWLLENYETAEGVSLPRSTLYNHYLRHCAATKIDAVNAASFGKLIRSVFIGLKTRRLGTRGNSKYHYYGIRIKPDSPLSTFPTDEAEMPTVAMRQPSQSSAREYVSNDSPTEAGDGNTQPQDLTPAQQHQQYLGETKPELTPFPEIDWNGFSVPGSITQDDISEFTAIYREHCEAILDVVINLQFQMVENLWHHFWADSKSSSPPADLSFDEDNDHQLPKQKLVLLASCQPVVAYLKHCDHTLYQCIVDYLIPEVLHPIPGTLTQAIRNFAKSLETSLSGSLHGYPSKFVKAKICSVVAFSQTLRRYTSLNHLAQAARAVLQNPSQISQMLADLNRVDFVNIQEQASWVCECKESLVVQLEQDFKTTLQQQQSLEQWAVWLEDVVNTVLEPYSGRQEFDKAAREFLLKWSFYSSMVIRDLTLRSAASFGSFHLIRLLYDEYMFFLIEHKVAKATGRTPIAVMSEFSGHSKRVLAASESVMSSDIHQDADDEDSPPSNKRQKLQ